MHALVVMHRRTLYENVDSAKINVPFYTKDIVILRVASMHRIVIHCIDISMNRYTPRIKRVFIVFIGVWCEVVSNVMFLLQPKAAPASTATASSSASSSTTATPTPSSAPAAETPSESATEEDKPSDAAEPSSAPAR